MNNRLQLQDLAPPKKYEFQYKIGRLRELPGDGLHSGEAKASNVGDERLFFLADETGEVYVQPFR